MRRTTALLVGGATAVALALGGLVGGVLAESPSAVASSAAPSGQSVFADRALTGAVGGVTASTVIGLEEEVRARPADADLLVQLAFAYQLRWRETADASFLPRSEVALRRALREQPRNATAVLGLGSLALIQHEFRQALAYGQRAARFLRGSARPYGVIGDALVELGRYEAAFASFERMVSLRPSLASYARVAYARELTGDLEGAVTAMRLALDAAGGQPEPAAWSLVELAKLELALGRVDAAGRDVRQALRILPGYPAARAELARTELARGRVDQAVAAARRAAEAVPTQQAVALLGDLLERSGRPAEARRQRATVAVIDRLLRANGVRVDLESAVYRADQRIRPAQTVALARRARADRPSIYGDDALGWALARAGRCAEAVPWARQSLRLGTKDPLLHFHLGYAQACAGNRRAMRESYGRALALNGEFSARWAPLARKALTS
ncbi:MAG: tetratricopeptide repeat protein [Actinobacteria bacterium]|nr:tetratricopeptide repeat protein [Actinomycetota bacterium]